MARSKVVRKVVTLEIETATSNKVLAREIRYLVADFCEPDNEDQPSIKVKQVQVNTVK